MYFIKKSQKLLSHQTTCTQADRKMPCDMTIKRYAYKQYKTLSLKKNQVNLSIAIDTCLINTAMKTQQSNDIFT